MYNTSCTVLRVQYFWLGSVFTHLQLGSVGTTYRKYMYVQELSGLVLYYM